MVRSLLLLPILALTFPIEDVTLPNGVRLITSPADGPRAQVESPDGRVIVVGGPDDPAALRAGLAARPSPSPSPQAPPPASARESWQVRAGAPSLVIEWPLPSVDPAPLLPFLDGLLERRADRLRYTVEGEALARAGGPAEARRRIDDTLRRLSSLTPRDLAPWKQACAAWAAPRTTAERARRLLQVTLATGNPRRLREAPEACARLTAPMLSTAARALPRVGRRVVLTTQTAP